MKNSLETILDKNILPEYDELHQLLEECISCLESENSFYRPYSKLKGKSFGGGLLDFTGQEKLPVIVVPDLHARGKFIVDLLDFNLPETLGTSYEGMTVLDALEQKKIYIVCVGDLFHSEGRGCQRWKNALKKYAAKEYESEEMKSEMAECLGLLQMVMTLKVKFQDNFHILKGNHENILNSSERGNHPFYKFADEGNMVYDFMASHYDDLIIQEIDWFESNLPVCALFKNAVISHGEPSRSFSRKEIINYHSDYDVVYGLTWTQNDFAEAGSVEDTMKNLLGTDVENCVWISGHRPVYEKYALRAEGRLVQIHNPNEENVAIVIPDVKFNPETDIYSVES